MLNDIRSWREALLPLGKCVFDPNALCALIQSYGLYEKLLRWHGHDGPFPIRLEVRGVDHEKRTAFIRSCIPALGASGLSNAPGAYAAELRVETAGSGATVYVKLTTAPDARFSYREKALPASIHPADAAALIRFAFPSAMPSRVLDPCCGSGTLLIEYGKFKQSRLFGVDIAHSAIEAARGNAKAAKLDVQLVRKDLREFVAGEPFDAVVANLPFGLRAGTHGENKTLYPTLLDRLPQWLKKGGVAALYTADAKLLLREINKRHFLKSKNEAVLDAGGLRSHLFVLTLL